MQVENVYSQETTRLTIPATPFGKMVLIVTPIPGKFMTPNPRPVPDV